jgi:hypothetical protein
VGRAAGPRDDHQKAAFFGLLCVLEHPVGRAVGRDHAQLVGHPQLAQDLGRGREDLEITLRAHDDGDERRLGEFVHDPGA